MMCLVCLVGCLWDEVRGPLASLVPIHDSSIQAWSC